MARRPARVSGDTKAELLEAATAEFYESGYQKASLRAICSRASLTTGALYFFFRNKEDLFQNVIAPVIQPSLEMLEAHFADRIARAKADGKAEMGIEVEAASMIMHLFFEHRTISAIILKNRDIACVSEYLDKVVEITADHVNQLLEIERSGRKSNGVFTDEIVHWYSHLQVDVMLHILEHIEDEEEADKQYRTMIAFMSGGMDALVEIDES